MLKARGTMTAIAFALGVPAAAAANVETTTAYETAQTATVSYADLDLSDERGANALQRRIATAARHVCGRSRAVDLDSIKVDRQCLMGAVASAQRAFDEALTRARHGSVTVTQGASVVVIAPQL